MTTFARMPSNPPSLPTTLFLTARAECVCMNGHRTWRVDRGTRRMHAGADWKHGGLFVQRTHRRDWMQKPPTRFHPCLSEEMCLCAAAVAPISGNGLVGSLLTTHKPAVTVCPLPVSSQALPLRTHHKEPDPKPAGFSQNKRHYYKYKLHIFMSVNV